MFLLSKLYLWNLSRNKCETIFLPAYIDKIPTYAVRSNRYVKKVYISNGVRHIKYGAFYNCPNLRDVYFHGYVESIDGDAFGRCGNIKFHFARSISQNDRERMLASLTGDSRKKVAIFKPKCEIQNEDVQPKVIDNTVVISVTDTEALDFQTNEQPLEIKAEKECINYNDDTPIEIIFEENVIEEITSIQMNEEINTKNDEIQYVEEQMVLPGSNEDNVEVISDKETENKSNIDFEYEVEENFPAHVIKNENETADDNDLPLSKRKRGSKIINKDDAQEHDRRRFACTHSITDIKFDDDFIYSLIRKYSDLKSYYSNSTPIGMIDISKDEYMLLTQTTKKIIERNSDITLLNSFLGSVFLVKTVSRYDHKNNFWKTISDILGLDENIAMKYLKKCLLSFCSAEKLYFRYNTSSRSYSGTVLVHAIISRKILNKVVDFVYGFYIEECLETYDSNKIAEQVALFVSELSSDSDDETNGSEIGGIYKLSYSFKTACREFPDAMKDGIKSLLFNIDAFYHNNSNISYFPVFFHKAFNRWKIWHTLEQRKNSISEKEKTFVRKNFEKIHNNAVRLSKLNKCAYFLDESHKLYLFIPKQEIRKEYSANDIKIQLFDNGQLIDRYTLDCAVYGDFRFHTEEIEIELKNYYKQLSIRFIADDGTVLFDTKSQLYRNFVVFDTNLDEYNGRKMPQERFYVLHDCNAAFFADANYNSYPTANYIIESLETENDTEILVANESVFRSFSGMADSVIYVSSDKIIKSAKALKGGKEYRIYTEYPRIVLSPECTDKDEFIIDINTRHISIEELGQDVSIKELVENGTMFVNVVLRKKGSQKAEREWNIAVLSGFEYYLDKNFYFKEKNASLLDIYAENVTFCIEEYPYIFQLNSMRKLMVNCIADDIDFYVEIKIPMLYWEIDKSYNSLSGEKYIPSEIIKNSPSLLCEIPDENMSVFAVNENVARNLTMTHNKCSLSDFIRSESESTSVGIRSQLTGETTLFEIIYSPVIRELSVECNINELLLSWVQIGVPTIEFSITDQSGTEVFTRKYDNTDNGNYMYSEDISEIPDGIYTVKATIIISDEFGFSEERKSCGEFKITKGNPFIHYLNNNDMTIQPEFCHIDGQKKRVFNFFCENVKSNDNGESGVYHAMAYFNKSGCKKYFVKANPITIELIEKNNDIITFTILDNQRDGFIYEKQRGYLQYDPNGLRDYYNYELPDHYSINL